MEFKGFVLVAVYVPCSGDLLKRLPYRLNEWDVDFHTYLKYLEKTRNKPVVVGGDLNVAHREIDIYEFKDTKVFM
jgi:exodeoxyribonuclease-3